MEAGAIQTAQQGEEAPMPTSPGQLMDRLRSLGIDFRLFNHKAVFTVAESQTIEQDIPGVHCRNLFVRDKKENMFLITLKNETKVDMKRLPPVIGSDRLSFGSAERLWQYLGVRPGSVCPFSIVNDTDKKVRMVLDKAMMEADLVSYHPLLNTMTVTLKPKDLVKFVESCGHTPHIVDLSHARPEA